MNDIEFAETFQRLIEKELVVARHDPKKIAAMVEEVSGALGSIRA